MLPLIENSYYELFDITLAETRQDPKDPKISCVHYDENNTFVDCCSKEAEAKFLPLLGCVPPWFTDDQDKVCQMEDTERINSMNEAILTSYFDLMVGK